ncbi:OXIDATIVE STRESS 3 LIKE 1-like protein [Drosera capensis]
MSIAVRMSSNHRINDIHEMAPCLGILKSSEIQLGAALTAAAKVGGCEWESGGGSVSSLASSASSSSIGKNSDDLVGKEDEEDGDGEVQSSLKSSFDEAVDALEEALPIRKGISKFYNGKSKSFATLSEASTCSSIKDITKPENAYSRKRKNLLAHSILWDKKPSPSFLRSPCGGISKRTTNSSRNTLAFAVTMGASIDETRPHSGSGWTGFSPPFSPSSSPPPFSRGGAAWRSFSVADLRHCSGVVNCSSPSPP